MRNRYRNISIQAFAIVLALSMAMITTACPPNSQPLVQKAAVASRDASTAIRSFQTWEIGTYESPGQTIISQADHATIQNILLRTAYVGKRLDDGLRASTTDAGALLAIDSAIGSFTSMIQTDSLEIRNPTARNELVLALTAVRAGLQVLHTVLAPAPATS
jgi:hypothetical protein